MSATAGGSAAVPDYVSSWKDDEVRELGALAECATTAHVGRVFVDSCIQRHLDGGLDATTAAMAKWWLTEQQVTVIDRCLQLYGGYGYMREYPIARMYADARVQKIYGGANEIMKHLVARSLR